MSRARRGIRRREFLAGALTLPAARIPRLARPSDEWGVAVIGLNGRGAEHAAALRAIEGVRLVALCDVDDHVAVREARRLRERTGLRVDLHSDLRYVLERADVHAVVLATPDHWHALAAIWACQAGKDAFIEPPATHLFGEGAPLAAAVAKHGRIVHCNLPARASPALREAIEWLRAGNLGALELVRALHYSPQPPIGKITGNQVIPDFVDYDLWSGPAPLLPVRRAKLHRDWRSFFPYGEGALGDAAEVLDLARWALGAEGLPESVISTGMRAAVDDGEAPDSQVLFFAYANAPLLVEVRGMPRDKEAQAGDWAAGMDEFLGVRSGVIVHATHGTLRITSASTAVAHDGDGAEVRRFEAPGDALAAWVDACRQRDQGASGVEAGVRSSALAHLGLACHRVGSAAAPEKVLEAVATSGFIRSSVEGLFKHLRANGVDIEHRAPVLGSCLYVDHERACFRENPEANALLAGSHREPYVLPAAD